MTQQAEDMYIAWSPQWRQQEQTHSNG